MAGSVEHLTTKENICKFFKLEWWISFLYMVVKTVLFSF